MSDTKMLSREAVIAIVSIREFDLPLTRSEANKILESDQLQRDRITELEGRLSRLDEDVRIAIGSTPGGREALGQLLDAAPFDAPAALNRYAVWARETIARLAVERDEAVAKAPRALAEPGDHSGKLVAICTLIEDGFAPAVEGPKEWRCVCRITLPRCGTKTSDGYLRCQECKRVWTLEGVLVYADDPASEDPKGNE